MPDHASFLVHLVGDRLKGKNPRSREAGGETVTINQAELMKLKLSRSFGDKEDI